MEKKKREKKMSVNFSRRRQNTQTAVKAIGAPKRSIDDNDDDRQLQRHRQVRDVRPNVLDDRDMFSHVNSFLTREEQLNMRSLNRGRQHVIPLTPEKLHELKTGERRTDILFQVQQNGKQLKDVHPFWRGDREIVLAAVHHRLGGYALQLASRQLRDDPDIVWAAVHQHGQLLKYASPRLRNDIDIVWEAVTKHPLALGYASAELRANRDFMLAVLEHHDKWAFNFGQAVEYASSDLRDDQDYVLAAVKKNAHALQWASARLRDNYEIVLAAVQNDDSALSFASEQLRRDPRIRRAAFASS